MWQELARKISDSRMSACAVEEEATNLLAGIRVPRYRKVVAESLFTVCMVELFKGRAPLMGLAATCALIIGKAEKTLEMFREWYGDSVPDGIAIALSTKT
ncbi:MAG: hypothetical protein AAB874_03290 [Patescibacteria group bacterium]